MRPKGNEYEAMRFRFHSGICARLVLQPPAARKMGKSYHGKRLSCTAKPPAPQGTQTLDQRHSDFTLTSSPRTLGSADRCALDDDGQRGLSDLSRLPVATENPVLDCAFIAPQPTLVARSLKPRRSPEGARFGKRNLLTHDYAPLLSWLS